MIPYSRQHITSSDVKSVTGVLKSDLITQGKIVPEFENLLCKTVGAKFATAVNSATSALHIACLSLGLKKGDYLWTSTNTFVASANCGLYCGAKIDLIDINEKNFNLSIEYLENKLIIARKKNKLPKIIVSVHFSGNPNDQERLFILSKKYKFKIIEDASHSLGASRFSEKVGNCKWSDITIFSFHPVKIITSGEGGAALTNSKKLNGLLKRYREHGIERNQNLMKYKNKEPWYFEQNKLGFNYRMTDIHAALGLSQLKRLKVIVKKRNMIANMYFKKLKHPDIRMIEIDKNNVSSFHLFPILVPPKLHLKVFNYLRKNGINVGLHYIPIYRHPYFEKSYKRSNFPNSEYYYSSVISIPIYYQLKIKEVDLVCHTLIKALKTFSKYK